MDDSNGDSEVALVEDGTRFGERDATLFGAIDRTGSMNRAATELGRSQARVGRRIDVLEDAFGALVVRQRGGSSGGGSELTERARILLDRYARLTVAVGATTAMAETVFCGEVIETQGELATVETPIGRIRGLHDGLTPETPVQVRIGSDALTLHDPAVTTDPDTTSARNRCRGTVRSKEVGESIVTVRIAVEEVTFEATITKTSEQRLDIATDRGVILSWKATATHVLERHADRVAKSNNG